MKTHLALLRGINVSGHKIIKMEDLRMLMTGAGFENVATYIQSGNIIFESKETSKENVSAKIKELIRDKYGWEVGVLMLDLSDLEKTVKNNPFLKEKNVDLKRVYVAFLSGTPAKENLEKFTE